MAPSPTPLHVSFRDADSDGVFSLNGAATIKQLARLGHVLRDGLELQASDGWITVTGTIRNPGADGFWRLQVNLAEVFKEPMRQRLRRGYLRNILDLITPNIGVSDEGFATMLKRVRSNPDRRELDGLRRELMDLYTNADTNWVELLSEEDHEVYDAVSQEDGRNFVTMRIWNVLFPEDMNCPPLPET